MKRNVFIRLCAMVMTFVLVLPVLSLRAEAGISDLVKKHMENSGVTSRDSLSEMIEEYSEKQNNTTEKDTTSGIISGKWSDEKFWRNNRYTVPYELDSTLNSCTGFTMDFELVEINAGNLLSGDFKFEVYVRTTSGSWKSVDSFYVHDYVTTVDVELDAPLSFDAVAVVCQKKVYVEYTQDMTIRNATYRSSTKKDGASSSSSNNTVSSGKIPGSWAEEKFWRNSRSTYPFEFSSTLTRCKGFTLNYEITEVTRGNLDGNFKFAVYVRNSGGTWKYVHEFKMNGYSVSTDVRFDPMSIDAVAVFCLKDSNLSYSYTMSVTDPV